MTGPSAPRNPACGFSVYAANSGVMSRATSSDMNTATATVKPNWMKN